MKIPKSLKVGGKKIKIKKLKKLKRAIGEWYPNKYKILLHDSKKAPPERLEESLHGHYVRRHCLDLLRGNQERR